MQSNENAVVDAVKSAVEIGYRHVDTAAMYNTEPAIGKAINELIADKKITREDIFVTTKVRTAFK